MLDKTCFGQAILKDGINWTLVEVKNFWFYAWYMASNSKLPSCTIEKDINLSTVMIVFVIGTHRWNHKQGWDGVEIQPGNLEISSIEFGCLWQNDHWLHLHAPNNAFKTGMLAKTWLGMAMCKNLNMLIFWFLKTQILTLWYQFFNLNISSCKHVSVFCTCSISKETWSFKKRNFLYALQKNLNLTITRILAAYKRSQCCKLSGVETLYLEALQS